MKVFSKWKLKSQLLQQIQLFKKHMEQFLQILSLIPVGIYICEPGENLYLNNQFRMFFGKPGDADEAIVSNMQTMLNEHQNESEFKITHNGQIFFILVTHVTEAQIMYVITDITNVEKMHIKELQSRHKSQLLLSFTHEFKTPLHWLSCSLSSISVPTEQRELLKAAKHATSMLNSYIEDMINYNLDGEVKTRQVTKSTSLTTCIKECIKFMEEELNNKEVEIEISNMSELPSKVMIDPIGYKQILNNILCNSVKSLPICTGAILLRVYIQDQRIYTTITDNGSGLGSEEISQILRPFEAESNTLQIRHGIGMLLIRELCKRLKGDISIKSAKENGTVYTFWVPLTLPFEPIAENAELLDSHQHYKEDTDELMRSSRDKCSDEIEALPTTIKLKKMPTAKDSQLSDAQFDRTGSLNYLKLLIVDDTKYNNKVLKTMLQILKLSCSECYNGKEAVDEIVRCGNSIPYSLIFMDINMPVMDGIEVLA